MLRLFFEVQCFKALLKWIRENRPAFFPTAMAAPITFIGSKHFEKRVKKKCTTGSVVHFCYRKVDQGEPTPIPNLYSPT